MSFIILSKNGPPHRRLGSLLLVLPVVSLLATDPARAEVPLRTVRESASTSEAVLRVNADQRSPHPISHYLTGKFSEHLGANIYGGMDAQLLANPTFGKAPFRTGEYTTDGGAAFIVDEEEIDARVRTAARRAGWPGEEIDNLNTDRRDALATFWGRVGPRGAILPSPDTGPYGSRAQRVGVKRGGQGIAQWTYLPLHRTRSYEFEIFIRSPAIETFSVSLTQGSDAVSRVPIRGVSGQWQKFTGTIELDSSFTAGEPCKFSLIANSPGQFVVQRILLRPSDHIDGADPDVVRFLKESRLPILRWPGGNFVSAYHWRDGVGPFETRPTVPNLAWGGLEPNLFGTDEFLAFCRAVGTEPMICVNAGTGTPREAARWVEYCNGPADSPMGKLRAANGHPEPYNIRHWEIGNELWGKWQVNWTTPAGNADRYAQFSEAMLEADPTITLYGTGAPFHWGDHWNDTLIKNTGGALQRITDHALVGGELDRSVEPLDAYSDYMAVPEALAARWSRLWKTMSRSGIEAPRLAVTELQIFPSLAELSDPEAPVELTRSNLVGSKTQAEALHSILFYHTAVRLSPFVEIITHSATVNHGGGLRKYREQVYANPCHYAQAAFATLAGATPVAVEIECAIEEAPLVVPNLGKGVDELTFGAIDAIAAVSEDELWLSIVHRGRSGAVELTVELNGFEPSGAAEVRTLSAETPWSVNSARAPENIIPVDSLAAVQGNQLSLLLAPYSVVRVRVPKAEQSRTSAPAEGIRPENIPTVVCFGDSITYAGYPAELANLLPVRAINSGVGGNTSRQGLRRLEQDVLAHKPDAVVILFGTNDTRVDAPGVYVPLPEYEKNLTEMIDRCREIGAKVILGTMPPINSDAYFTRHSRQSFEPVGGLETLTANYRAAVLRIGKAKGAPVVDFNQLLAGEAGWRAPDGVHPTLEGNRVIAKLVTEKLEAVLSR